MDKKPLLSNSEANKDIHSTEVNSEDEDDSTESEIEGSTFFTTSVRSTTSRTAAIGGLDSGETGTTNFQTLIHIFKGNIGTGILSLPSAIKHAGVIAGPTILLAVALIAIHCMHLLVKCSHHFCKSLNRQAMGYGDVAEECSRSLLGRKAHYAKFLVNFFLVLTQIGFCSVYLVFVASTTIEIFELENKVDKRLVIVIVGFPVILLSYIRSLEKLAYISIVSNLLCLYGLITVFQYLFRDLKSPSNYPAVAPLGEMPLFLAMAMFSFEGIGIVLPLENEMKSPKDFPWVLNLGMGIVTSLFIAMGLTGYLTFGDAIKGSVSLNLPDDGLYDSVKVCYAIAMFLTYFLQFYVPIQILLPPLLNKYQKRHGSCFEYTFRTMLVLFTVALAAGIPMLDDFIALIGAVASSGLAMIFPPIIHTLTFREHGLYKLSWIKNITIFFIGIFAFVVGSYTTVGKIVSDLHKRHSVLINNATYINTTSAGLIQQVIKN